LDQIVTLREQNVDVGSVLADALRQRCKAMTAVRGRKQTTTIVVQQKAKAR
jgi:hypothetical protein